MRHLYDVHQLLQRKTTTREVTGRLRHLFQEIIESDRKQFGEKDKAFAENPTQRLNCALKYLQTDSSEFEALYGEFVNDLVWGQAVDFNEAREAFCALACQLLKSTR